MTRLFVPIAADRFHLHVVFDTFAETTAARAYHIGYKCSCIVEFLGMFIFPWNVFAMQRVHADVLYLSS